jgi:hypothetical protein
MLRTIFTIGVFALLGIFALRLVFGVLGGLMGLLIWLLGIAIQILIVGFIVYIVIRVISPNTARRIREMW